MSRSHADLVVDDRTRGLFRVDRQVFTDPEILERERREVFGRTWLYAAHESEIPKPGSFVSRRVAGRPLIIVRDDGGGVRVFFNSCTHRGNLVCWESAGQRRSFLCPYHAWSFNLKGELAGLPGAESYSPAFDRKDLALASPPRVESYRGLVFVSFDRAIESLVEYLGDAREYVDLMLDFGGVETEIAPGAQAYSMKANWKLLVENSLDGYHAASTHHRYFGQFLPDIGIDTSAARRTSGGAPAAIGRATSLGKGHTVIETRFPFPLQERAKDELAEIRRRLLDRFGAERTSLMMDANHNLLIFPNLILISMWRTLRTFYPVSPEFVEINAWCMVPRNESPKLRQLRFENFISFLGPAGFGTPDDVAGLEGCQRGFAAINGHAGWSDISRGMHRAEPDASDELQMRAFWRRWHALIQGDRGVTECSDRGPLEAGAA